MKERGEKMIAIKEEVVEELDGSTEYYTYFDAKEVALGDLLQELYENHWQDIMTTYLIPGGVFELFSKQPKRVSILQGYLTVDTGDWHLHICVSEPKIHDVKDVDKQKEIARQRMVKRGAFIHVKRGKKACTSESWYLRLWNGNDEQVVNIAFPSPHYDSDFKRLKEPDWTRVELWKSMCEKYLGITK